MSSENSIANIYQIYYDQASRNRVDPGFLPLDNCANERPDWREYWPIRTFLRNKVLNADALYGFFSPVFYGKTLLDSSKVHHFIRSNPGYDVYSFSPFRQDATCYLNIIEHGNRYHPGMLQLVEGFLRELGAEIDFHTLVMDLQTTIFCNYFVATPAFWDKWFALTEQLFAITEDPAHPLGRQIDALTDYRQKSPLNMKVFIVERIASLILSQDPSINIAAYDIEQMPWSDPAYSPYWNEMMTLNALKMAYQQTGNQRYLDNFFALRIRILNACERLFPQSPLQQRHFF